MNLLREYIRELLTEKTIAIGMCFPFAIQKAGEWWDQHYTPPADPDESGTKHPDLNDLDKFKVVHGEVTDKWVKPPKPIVHAWVEMGDLVFDDQTKHTKPDGIPKDFYYDMYQPEIAAEYTAEQALNKCAMSGYEGPWDENLAGTMRRRDARMVDEALAPYPLFEKETRHQKSKRTLYHIGSRPAEPKPMSRSYANTWRRYWLDQDVESGVFLSPNPIDIAQYHGVMGDVYAYKIPEWVIAKAGGVHRYDHGSEVLISKEVWEEAGDEIEFLGKSMTEDAIWEKIESLGAQPLRRTAGSRPGWMSDEEWAVASTDRTLRSHISGLRSTSHPENAIRMMTPEERAEALRAFEMIDIPGAKDREIIDMITSYMSESVFREYIREFVESMPSIHPESQIFCDMDGVLVNFGSAVIGMVNRMLDDEGIPASKSPGHLKRLQKIQDQLGYDWRASSRSDLDIKAVRNFMMGIVGSNPGPVFAGMSPWPDAMSELWPFLTSSGHTVNLLSAPIKARSPDMMTAGEGKIMWAEKHLLPPPADIIIIPAKNKKEYAVTAGIPNILIDDKPSTVQAWNSAGGIGILHQPGRSAATVSELIRMGL